MIVVVAVIVVSVSVAMWCVLLLVRVVCCGPLLVCGASFSISVYAFVLFTCV